MKASAAEFVLEGLYSHRRISRNEERASEPKSASARRPRARKRRAPSAASTTESAGGVRLPAGPPRPAHRGRGRMKIRYSRYSGEDMGIGAEDLLQALSDFLLQSGFNSQYIPFERVEPAHPGGPEEGHPAGPGAGAAVQRQPSAGDDGTAPADVPRADAEADRQPGAEAGGTRATSRSTSSPKTDQPATSGAGNGPEGKVRFEVTDKSLDFLGFKTLKDLLGSLGKSSFGRHDTRDLATGIESSGSSRQYEFGDSLNLDISETLFSAIRREGARVPLNLEYTDLHVHQCEYQSSCATRADAGLQPQHDPLRRGPLHPGQEGGAGSGPPHPHPVPPAIRCAACCSTIPAEELDISQLARVQVGPYYTNTRDGLLLAQRLLSQERKDMRQIVMITDGKPSCLTLGGRAHVQERLRAGFRWSSAARWKRSTAARSRASSSIPSCWPATTGW